MYVQSVLGRSAITSALVMLPGSIATALVNPFAGRIYVSYGENAMMRGLNVAFLSMSAGTLILILIAVIGICEKYGKGEQKESIFSSTKLRTGTPAGSK